MLRIRLNDEDLARVRFRLSSQSETIGSLVLLQRREPHPDLAWWRTRALARFPRHATSLLDLVGHDEGIPTFLIPGIGSRPMSDSLAEEMRRSLAARSDRREMLSLLGRLTRGPVRDDAHASAALSRAIRDYYAACLAPVAGTVGGLLRKEYFSRGHLLLTSGLTGVLESLSPAVRWHPPYLEVDSSCDDEHLLNGRGLSLIPSLFWTSPVFSADKFETPVLVYPVGLAGRSLAASPGDDVLASLIGRTRAAVARALRTGGGTGDIAARTGISAASASEHVAVLRRAGLASTTRRGKAVHHALTPLGVQFVDMLG